MNIKALNIFFSRFLIVVFFITIFTPSLRMIFGDKTAFSFTEKRPLAIFPQTPDSLFQVQSFFSGVDHYLNDQFGFREWMVYRYQREIRKRFGESEANIQVMRGSNNWYFFAGRRLLKDLTGRNLFSDEHLERWVSSYKEKQKWLENKGIRYLLLVPPDKTSIYGEFLRKPWKDNRGMSRFTQIRNRLSGEEDGALIDPAPVLLANKSENPLYWKSDTHWTPYGAYLAYQLVAEKIESMFPGLRFKQNFTFSPVLTRRCERQNYICGDLTNMVLDFDSFDEPYRKIRKIPRYARRRPVDTVLSNIKLKMKDSCFSTTCSRGTLKAVIFRDSFFVALAPYFAVSFKEVIFLWKGYDQKNIEELLSTFKPDIVIEERVERSL